MDILIVDDDSSFHTLVHKAFTKENRGAEFRCSFANGYEEAVNLLRKQRFRMALVDLHYGTEKSGFDLIEFIRGQDPFLQVIVFSSEASFAAAQKAIRLGANDYVHKGAEPAELMFAVEKAAHRLRLGRLEERMRLASVPALQAMAGDSDKMRRLKATIEKYAPSEAPVLIEAETGAGKELAAKAIHETAFGATAPFVAVNCGAVPATLAEGFFFGHERGAFTGAEREREGVFEQADGGTLFLDEVNSLPLDLQKSLLRVLEEREVRRLGSAKTIPLSFRLVVASNVSLSRLVAEGKFREDLYYRVNVLKVEIPPLRERMSDLPELLRRFLGELQISAKAEELFLGYSWPGNVRELRNVVAAMKVLAGADTMLDIMHIPEDVLAKMSAAIPMDGVTGSEDGWDARDFGRFQEEREKEFLAKVYRSTKGNVSRMSRVLSVDRSHLHQKLVKLGIHSVR